MCVYMCVCVCVCECACVYVCVYLTAFIISTGTGCKFSLASSLAISSALMPISSVRIALAGSGMLERVRGRSVCVTGEHADAGDFPGGVLQLTRNDVKRAHRMVDKGG